MKVIPATVCVLLVLLVTTPHESEAGIPIAWFVKVAAKAGWKLVKNAYYARCNTRNVPPGISCPGVVFGAGMTRNQAQNAARAYASAFGDPQCGRYVGHCDIYRFTKRRGK